jgi:hypothetical protein
MSQNARLALRILAAIASLVGVIAGYVVSNHDLVQAALPPRWAAIVTTAAPLVILVLHELAHQFPAPDAPPPPAAPATSDKAST